MTNHESKIMHTLNNLIEENNFIMVDAFYQWATNPTSMSAVKRMHRSADFTPIKKNIAIQYNISFEESEKIYGQMQKTIEEMGIDFHTEYFDYGDLITSIINKKMGGKFREEIIKKLKEASQNELYLIWLHFKLRNFSEFEYAFHTCENYESVYKSKFEAIYNASFPLAMNNSNILDSLVKFGFGNRQVWITSGKNINYHHGIYVPKYVETLISGLDKFISFPELPDYKKYIDALYENEIVEALIGLDAMLTCSSLTPSITDIHMRVLPKQNIVGRSESGLNHYCALNIRILREFEEYFYEKKLKELRYEDKFFKGLTKLEEDHYPQLSIELINSISESNIDIFKSSRIWEIDSYDDNLAESKILNILTPWLTAEQLKWICNNYQNEYVVITLTFMGLPKIQRLYHEIFNKNLAEDELKWMIIDLSKDKSYTLFANHKPNLFDAIIKITESIVGKAEGSIVTKDKTRKERVPTEETIGKKSSETIDTSKTLDITNDSSEKLKIFLGRKVEKSDSDEDVFWSPGDLDNGHLIIIGGSGSGKTETIRCISYELDKQNFPALLVDFHGDMGFEGPNINKYEITAESNYYFNPFELNPLFNEIIPLKATSDFVDSLYINYKKMGIQQKEELKTIICQAYQTEGITNDRSTWTKELKFENVEKEILDPDNEIDKTLKAYLGDSIRYRLFKGTNKISIKEILDGRITHLNLKGLPESLQLLYADLFLRKLHYSLKSLGEIPRDGVDDTKKFRMFVVVDEAKLLISEKNDVKAVLNKYATEMRKFGVGLILASQIIDHFNEEILGNVAAKYCMKTQNNKEAVKNSKYFDVRPDELQKLKPGYGILLLNEKKEKIKIVSLKERL